jgi:hypothetical protein
VKRTKVIESFASAAETIGPITPGMSLFTVTRGQFSMIDAIYHCLKQIGVAEVSLWTWTVATRHAEVMAGFLAQTEITRASLICDQSLDKRDPVLVETWRKRFGEETIKICKNHAKMARIWNRDFRLLLRGSMNLNVNPRFEQLDVTEGGEDFDLIERLEAELPVLPRKYSNHDTESATKVNRAFEYSQLKMFAGAKPWKNK